MSQRRLGLFLLMGSFLLVTPFLVSSSRSVEKSVFSAMATLADVKETLEGKQELLTEMYASLEGQEGAERAQTVELARKHYLYSKDVYRLARSFLSASQGRHPKYDTFWSRYDHRLSELWEEIESSWGRIEGGGMQFASAEDAGARNAVLAAPTAGEAEPGQVAPSPSRVASRDLEAEATREVMTETPAKKTEDAGELNARLLEKYREGYQLFARGQPADLEQAVSVFQEILDEQPSFHLARYWLSKTHILRDEKEEARVHADRLLSEQPNLQIARDLVREVQTLARRSPTRVAQAPKAPEKAVPVPAKPVRRAAPAVPVVPPAPVARAALPKPSPRKPTPPPARVARTPAPPASRPPGKTEVEAFRFDGDGPPPLTVPAMGPDGKYPRALAVMIENSRHARPQSGLLHADFVYEIPVEGGITRFMAVFQDPERDVPSLGPVRSARHYFVNQVPSLDAIYAHCGGSTQGYAALKQQGIDHIDEIKTGSGFWRNKKRKAPHNLYTRVTALRKGADRKGFRLTSNRSASVLPVMARAIRVPTEEYQDLELPYYHRYKVGYHYDPVTNLYSRTIDGEPHVDALTERQIEVENVVVLKAEMQKIDDYGRLDVHLIGRGDAQVHRGGEVIEAKWTREGRGERFTLRDSRGRPVEMNPGRTWIHVIQPNRKITLARRPLPPKVLATLREAKAPTRSAHPGLPPGIQIGQAPARASAGVPGVVTPARGVPAVIQAPRALPPARQVAAKAKTKPSMKTLPEPTSGELYAAAASTPPARKRSASEAPPVVAEPVVAAPPVVAAAEPASPKTEKNVQASRTWREGLGGEYDLADFTLDTF